MTGRADAATLRAAERAAATLARRYGDAFLPFLDAMTAAAEAAEVEENARARARDRAARLAFA